MKYIMKISILIYLGLGLSGVLGISCEKEYTPEIKVFNPDNGNRLSNNDTVTVRLDQIKNIEGVSDFGDVELAHTDFTFTNSKGEEIEIPYKIGSGRGGAVTRNKFEIQVDCEKLGCNIGDVYRVKIEQTTESNVFEFLIKVIK